jgi:AbrB family looped-hinge helix DNA binding protein
MKKTIGKGGRLVIPASYRRALGLHEGDEVIVRLEAGGVRILIVRHALQSAQKLIRQYVPTGRSLARELIAQRRVDLAQVGLIRLSETEGRLPRARPVSGRGPAPSDLLSRERDQR